MCTVTLSYNPKDAEARRSLASLFSTGRFVLEKGDDSLLIDYSDPWLYEDHGDLPPLPEGKETFTPEEALQLILNDIRNIYETEDVV